MKKYILLASFTLASSVTFAEIIGSGIVIQSGQHCTLIKSESDGSGTKTGEDGSGTKIGSDGTENKTEGDGSNNKTGNDGTDYELMLVCK